MQLTQFGCTDKHSKGLECGGLCCESGLGFLHHRTMVRCLLMCQFCGSVGRCCRRRSRVLFDLAKQRRKLRACDGVLLVLGGCSIPLGFLRTRENPRRNRKNTCDNLFLHTSIMLIVTLDQSSSGFDIRYSTSMKLNRFDMTFKEKRRKYRINLTEFGFLITIDQVLAR